MTVMRSWLAFFTVIVLVEAAIGWSLYSWIAGR